MRIKPLIPILASAGILLGANGLVMTLVSIRAKMEGFSDSIVGLVGTSYFAGLMIACLVTASLIKRAGHIRVFAALAAGAAIGTLLMILVISPPVWIAARFLMGFCFAGVAMVLESWLNELSTSNDRGRVLSLYRVVDLCFVTGFQFILPVVGVEGFQIFAVAAILLCLALVPVSLSRLSNPSVPESSFPKPLKLWALSPVACFGVITIGLNNAAFRTVGPVYAQGMGLSVDQVAIFIGLGIFAGAITQYPLGMMSDRFDRRYVLLFASTGAMLASTSTWLGLGETGVFLGAFLFGGFAFPLYSLSIAHANDYAKPGQYVEMAAGMTLFYGIGASVGPFASSLVMQNFGPQHFFTYTACLHLTFLIFILYRMTRRASLPRRLRKQYVSLMRTSPAIFKLARSISDKRTK